MKTYFRINVLASLLVSLLAASAFAELSPKTPGTDENGCYLISDADELYGFAALVNAGTDDADKACAVLTKNIVVNNKSVTANGSGYVEWTPIGTYDNPFQGTFDGDGHTVSGLYINMAVSSRQCNTDMIR